MAIPSKFARVYAKLRCNPCPTERLPVPNFRPMLPQWVRQPHPVMNERPNYTDMGESGRPYRYSPR